MPDTRAMGLTSLEEALKAGLKEHDSAKAEDKIGTVITRGITRLENIRGRTVAFLLAIFQVFV